MNNSPVSDEDVIPNCGTDCADTETISSPQKANAGSLSDKTSSEDEIDGSRPSPVDSTEDEIPEKVICESDWHEEIELDPFEECPRCKSRTYHRHLKLIDGKWI